MTVGLVASDLRQNILAEHSADALRLLHDYAGQAELLATAGARAIVIPEKIAVLLDSDLPQPDSLLQSTADKNNALIIVGVIHPTTGAKWNEARLYCPDGSIRTYEKHHMLPVYEGNLAVGTTLSGANLLASGASPYARTWIFPNADATVPTTASAFYSTPPGISTRMAGGMAGWRFFAESKADSASPAHPNKAFSASATIVVASSANNPPATRPSRPSSPPCASNTSPLSTIASETGWAGSTSLFY